MAPETWLVAHDFSPPANAAADLALSEALRLNTPVRLVITHIFCTTVPVTPDVVPHATMIGADAAMRNEVSPLLDKVAARLNARMERRSLTEDGRRIVTSN